MPSYGNPKGQIAVNFAAPDPAISGIPLTRLGLRVNRSFANPDADVGVAEQIRSRQGRNLLDQKATLKAESRRIFDRTFAVTSWRSGIAFT